MGSLSKHIVVFDSGIGGTSILTHLQAQISPARFSYLMDNKYLPYGELEADFLSERIITLLRCFVSAIEPVDLLVVACNTASTQTLDKLRATFTFPIVGVVPAIKPAAENTHTNKIGLLATPATVANNYTASLIEDFASSCEVKLYGSSELVKIAEQRFWSDSYNKLSFVEQFTKLKIDTDIDYLVLGCTHFPLMADAIQQLLGERIRLLDSGEAIAKRVASLLNRVDTRECIKKRPVDYYATAALEQSKLTIKQIIN